MVMTNMAARFNALCVFSRSCGSFHVRNLSYRNSGSFHMLGNSQIAVRKMSNLAQQFEEAKVKLNSLQNEPDNDTKLKIYALFKQVTVGKCNTKQPGVFDMVGRAKWTAWSSLGEMSKDAACKKYVDLVTSLASDEGGPTVSASPASGSSDFKTIKVTQDGAIRTILLNRPNKYNAIDITMYNEIIQALDEAGRDPETVVTVVTGAGDYYCSGNDLTSFANITTTVEQMAEDGRVLLKKFVASFIDFPKILIALVNGPAVGISVTLLSLFDVVLAVDKATFHTPFTLLGQSPEGCSSYLFPILMGTAKANDMLLFNKKLTATEAYNRRLVTEVLSEHEFQKTAWERVKNIASLPPKALLSSKHLIRNGLQPKLHEVNDAECKLLRERWLSDECFNAIAKFMTRKSNL